MVNLLRVAVGAKITFETNRDNPGYGSVRMYNTQSC